MAQIQTTSSLADVPMPANARRQFQQYLVRASTSSPTAASGSSAASSSTDLDALLRRSAQLTSRVDVLHAQLSSSDDGVSTGSTDDPQLFWSTVTLLTQLRELSSELQRSPKRASDRRASDALKKTQQNLEIAESLLRVLSVSSSREGGSNAFTAPLKPASAPMAATSAAGVTYNAADRKGYEYWKQKTLSALDADDHSSQSATSLADDEEGDISDSDSVLTDPDVHLAPTTRLGGLKPSTSRPNDDDEDLSEYDRALSSSSKSPPETHSSTAGQASASAPAPTGSDTILQSDRATHDALSSELLRMASILKSNSLAFADALERDRLLLEKAGNDLGQNLDLMTRTRGRLGVYSKKARSMGWFTLSAILIVIVSWMLMFLLIRLT